MQCPDCGGSETRVIDSRDLGGRVRRRRQCPRCRARFTTYEQVHSRVLFVVKKDGRREEFSREKLLGGVRRACEKRPLPAGAIEKLVDEVENEIYRQGRLEVSTSLIGDLVMDRLKEIDYIAYIRFASVYREFADISALKQEVDTLVQNGTVRPPTNQLTLLPKDQLQSLSYQVESPVKALSGKGKK
jgi:transcriptional repressor NrdR